LELALQIRIQIGAEIEKQIEMRNRKDAIRFIGPRYKIVDMKQMNNNLKKK
tara:strand:+ start:650 stop:802 length:153 start_codon:yes stop_codon:yes gene_type:complete